MTTLSVTVSSTPQLSRVGTIIGPILQIRKPGLREVSKFLKEGGRQNIPQLGKFLLLKEKAWPQAQWEVAFSSGAASLRLGI